MFTFKINHERGWGGGTAQLLLILTEVQKVSQNFLHNPHIITINAI